MTTDQLIELATVSQAIQIELDLARLRAERAQALFLSPDGRYSPQPEPVKDPNPNAAAYNQVHAYPGGRW